MAGISVPLYLPHIAPISPPYLPHISPNLAQAERAWRLSVPAVDPVVNAIGAGDVRALVGVTAQGYGRSRGGVRW